MRVDRRSRSGAPKLVTLGGLSHHQTALGRAVASCACSTGGVDVDQVKTRLDALRNRPVERLPVETLSIVLRPAAVLLLVWAQDDAPMLAVTRRAAHLRAHAREISLPGGRCDLDEMPEAAALREAGEELGIDTRRVSILGRMDDAWS